MGKASKCLVEAISNIPIRFIPKDISDIRLLQLGQNLIPQLPILHKIDSMLEHLSVVEKPQKQSCAISGTVVDRLLPPGLYRLADRKLNVRGRNLVAKVE